MGMQHDPGETTFTYFVPGRSAAYAGAHGDDPRSSVAR